MSAEKLTADFESHHIEGWAVHGGAHFSVPLVSHIVDNLWTGGCIGGVRLGDDFTTVVSLYPWEQYAIGRDTDRVEIRMYDAGETPAPESLLEAVACVLIGLDDGKTLVHCQAGLNRSGLVAALTLMALGMTPDEAVELLREKRCDAVLCNPAFARWLHTDAARELADEAAARHDRQYGGA